MIIQKVGPEGNKRWQYESSPNAIRIVEEGTFFLRYSITPPDQDTLVIVDYWIKDHNRMVRMLEALEWTNNECLLCGGFKPKHEDWCSFNE
jgi:hypothetical protein